MRAASSLSERHRLVRRLQHQRQKAQVLADVGEIADDGVHDAVRILDDRAHVLLRVGFGSDRTWRRTGGSQAGRPTSSRAAACRWRRRGRRGRPASRRCGSRCRRQRRRWRSWRRGRTAELQALGNEAAGRVEDDGDAARGRQLGDFGLQLEKLAADQLAAEEKRRGVRAADVDARETWRPAPRPAARRCDRQRQCHRAPVVARTLG